MLELEINKALEAKFTYPGHEAVATALDPKRDKYAVEFANVETGKINPDLTLTPIYARWARNADGTEGLATSSVPFTK